MGKFVDRVKKDIGAVAGKVKDVCFAGRGGTRYTGHSE